MDEWTNEQMDKQTNGKMDKFFLSLTFISMTHVTMMILRYKLSETQADRQTTQIYIYIYICI